MSAARQPRKWTVTEDHKLREEVEAQMSEGEVKDWCRVASTLPGRTNKDCRKRWFNSVAGGLKKGQWSKSEDLQLSHGVQQYGQRWTQVAQVVSSRSADQCAKRWQQSLDPDLDRSEWRDLEDKILIEAVQTRGRHWKDIQQNHFPGRSKNCIKNRYTVLQRRYQNQGIPLPDAPSTPESAASNPKRLSAYSMNDDDAMSYHSGVYEDLLPPQPTQTQVSTPETRNSWTFDNQPYSGWSSQESFSMTASAPDLSTVPAQYPPSGGVDANQWSWSASPMRPAQVMNLHQHPHPHPQHAYTHSLSAPPLTAYSTYSPVATMASLSPNYSVSTSGAGYSLSPARVLTSSPRIPSMYHDPNLLPAAYGAHADPSYHYQR